MHDLDRKSNPFQCTYSKVKRNPTWLPIISIKSENAGINIGHTICFWQMNHDAFIIYYSSFKCVNTLATCLILYMIIYMKYMVVWHIAWYTYNETNIEISVILYFTCLKTPIIKTDIVVQRQTVTIYRLLYFIIQSAIITLRTKQNGRHFPDDIFKCIIMDENIWLSIKIA